MKWGAHTLGTFSPFVFTFGLSVFRFLWSALWTGAQRRPVLNVYIEVLQKMFLCAGLPPNWIKTHNLLNLISQLQFGGRRKKLLVNIFSEELLSGLPDFSWRNVPKRGKIYYKMTKKFRELNPRSSDTKAVARTTKFPKWP
jgi:hypothetical protein